MAMYELADSRSGSVELRAGEIAQKWMLIGSNPTNPNEEQAVYAFVVAETVEFYWFWQRKKIDQQALGGGNWLITLTYGVSEGATQGGQTGTSPAPSQPGGSDPLTNDFSFDTTGQTIHVSQSLKTVTRTAIPGEAAPDVKQAVGVTQQGVEGVDVVSPKLEFQISRNFYYVTLDYLILLRNLTGTVNEQQWYQFPAGELLFLGASGQNGQDGVKRITYRFAASPNQANVQVNGTADLALTFKKGWEYVWCMYKDAVVDGRAVKIPFAAYLEQLYRETNFSLLGI